MRFVNALRLILCTLWLGAAVFFSAVVAPAAFGVLRSFNLANASQLAGDIVARNLAVINISGLIVGLFLLLTLFIVRGRRGRAALITEFICTSVIIAATSVSHWLFAARMRDLRVAIALPFDQVPINDGRRMAFDSLHAYSVNALGLAMIAALVIIILIARSGRN
ncbi:MAG TPA: DUF4149 domain-containing protein [Pyrinomonadaceae bacterium]|nr:DUF4149 domain-containing protein [Pyrinomonadaceae bacterium]